ncbi:hypothetical protein E1293_27055 [Actinomadura darangshiensis]|uniref:Uncharacterized protein n=1 Tax=Actinomadura darangshiensis TaxID=705336 RepID=A0A4R5ATG9_9ACTN|nr:hypothetical protein [Actinomadura darangshiensis]TDD76568.1 hypothetical protein E1293_27055 [Actinomadura darangshiensis]
MARGAHRAVGRWQAVLRWRTAIGDETAVRNLEVLAIAVKRMGWRCVELYEEEHGFPMPLLWVYASGAAEDVGAVVTVRATAGGGWGYFEVGQGRGGFLFPCGDAKAAAERVDRLLKYRMFPNPEWA